MYTVHVIQENIDGGASAPVGPSVATPLGVDKVVEAHSLSRNSIVFQLNHSIDASANTFKTFRVGAYYCILYEHRKFHLLYLMIPSLNPC